jgi:hypothetical protein
VAWYNGPVCLGSATISQDGFIRIYVGGDGFTVLGTLAYTSQTMLMPNTFTSIDIDWFFPSSGKGWASLYIDDTLDASPLSPGGPSASGISWGGVPDTFGLIANVPFTPGNGFNTADLAVSDGQGSVNNGRLGPCRVAAYFPGANALIQWPGIFPATGDAWDAVNDQPEKGGDPFLSSPDGDTSLVFGGTAGQEDLFSFLAIPCYAQILGVALNVCAQAPAGGSLGIVVRPQPAGGIDYSIGGGVCPSSYAVMQAISEINPLTGLGWLDGELINAWWGVSAASGSPSVTQICLEKVTTRRAVPFTCGFLGSYSVQGQGS